MAQPSDWKGDSRSHMKSKKADRVWVVVDVRSGVPVQAEVFSDEASAGRYERTLRSQIRENYDAVDVFETTIRQQSSIQ